MSLSLDIVCRFGSFEFVLGFVCRFGSSVWVCLRALFKGLVFIDWSLSLGFVCFRPCLSVCVCLQALFARLVHRFEFVFGLVLLVWVII